MRSEDKYHRPRRLWPPQRRIKSKRTIFVVDNNPLATASQRTTIECKVSLKQQIIMPDEIQRLNGRASLPSWATELLRRIKTDDPMEDESIRQCKRLLQSGKASAKELSRVALALETWYTLKDNNRLR